MEKIFCSSHIVCVLGIVLCLANFFLAHNVYAAYGRSFPDVVKGVEHTLQSLLSDRETTPANFKYKRSLENQVKPCWRKFRLLMNDLSNVQLPFQLSSTMLHLLSLVSSCHFDALTDFLLRVRNWQLLLLIPLLSLLDFKGLVTQIFLLVSHET